MTSFTGSTSRLLRGGARRLASLALASCVALPSTVHALGAPAPSLSYNTDAGDIVMNSVMVPAAPTMSTYYEVLGWNFGAEGGGYTGLQWTPERIPSGGPVFIFSLWDPIATTNEPIVATYTAPGTETRRFGGEGTGLNSMNWTLGWVPDRWYNIVVRRWACGNAHTCFGHWINDTASGVWTHNITMDYPVPDVSLGPGTYIFLEDFAWNGLKRSMYVRNLYKRVTTVSSPAWRPGTRASFGVSDPEGTIPLAYDARVVGSAFYLEAGTGATASLAPGTSLGEVPMPDTPAPIAGKLTRVEAAGKLGDPSIKLDWTIDPVRSPQFSYRVKVRRVSDGGVVYDQDAVVPHARTATLPVALDEPMEVALSVRDIFDQWSDATEPAAWVAVPVLDAPATTTRPATAVTEAGVTLNSIVTSNGHGTIAGFELGTTTAYGKTVSATQNPFAASAAGAAASATVNGLACGTTYHFRAVASHATGKATGADASFHTTACPATPLGTATIVSSPYGAISPRKGATISGNTITFTGLEVELHLGYGYASANTSAQLDFGGLSLPAGGTLRILSGAAEQAVTLRDISGNPTVVRGTIELVPLLDPGPRLTIRNAKGVTVQDGGRIASAGGLVIDTLGNTPTAGSPLQNDGVVDGGASLAIAASRVNGSGSFTGDAILLQTFGNANNPAHGGQFLRNGLALRPSPASSTVALTLNGYGASPQVFNLRVDGSARLAMPSTWAPGVTRPANNAVVAPGATRPPGQPNPAYGGGSMIIQATGSLALARTGSGDFAFPGAVVLVAGQSIDLGGVPINQGWNTDGKAFQGVYLEAPSLYSIEGPIAIYGNELNWVNFSSRPTAPVVASKLARNGDGSASFVRSDDTTPHLNTFSRLIDAAARGECWTCLVNTSPVDMTQTP